MIKKRFSSEPDTVKAAKVATDKSCWEAYGRLHQEPVKEGALMLPCSTLNQTTFQSARLSSQCPNQGGNSIAKMANFTLALFSIE